MIIESACTHPLEVLSLLYRLRHAGWSLRLTFLLFPKAAMQRALQRPMERARQCETCLSRYLMLLHFCEMGKRHPHLQEFSAFLHDFVVEAVIGGGKLSGFVCALADHMAHTTPTKHASALHTYLADHLAICPACFEELKHYISCILAAQAAGVQLPWMADVLNKLANDDVMMARLAALERDDLDFAPPRHSDDDPLPPLATDMYGIPFVVPQFCIRR